MKKTNFLNKLKEEGNLSLVEQSETICISYILKSDNSLKSAKILRENKLYDDSTSSSYYAMYNILTALLFKTGIKCENHAGSILLLKFLLNKVELFDLISKAKEDRIDKQYYVTSEDITLTEESTKKILIKAEEFTVKMKLVIKNMKNEEIINLREKFQDI